MSILHSNVNGHYSTFIRLVLLGSVLYFWTKDVCFVSSDRYKSGLYSSKRNLTNMVNHVAGPTPHKVQLLDHRELGAIKKLNYKIFLNLINTKYLVIENVKQIFNFFAEDGSVYSCGWNKWVAIRRMILSSDLFS